MRKLLYTALIFFGTFGLAQAQCDAEKFMDVCNAKLSDGYTFLKQYSIDGAKATSGKKVEYSYVFSKNTQYMLTLCSENKNPKNMYVTLYDSQRNPLMSSFIKDKNEFLSKVAYQCSSTGIYYLSFQFAGSDPTCGGSILAFKR